MAKYKQILNYDNEDSFGSNSIEFIISDDLTNLVDDSEAGIVDIFNFQKLKVAFQNEQGGLVQDECDFISADFLVKNATEQSALDLVKSSDSTTIYCAIVINKDTAIEASDVYFSGIVESKYSVEGDKWDRDEYDTTANISKAYKFSIVPMTEFLFDTIKLEDAINNIDSTWIAANVENKKAWREMSKTVSSTDYKINAYCCDLVNLNKLLRKTTDEALSILNTNLATSFSVNYNVVKLPGKYAPARWVVNPNKYWIDAPLNNYNPNDRVRTRENWKWHNAVLYHNFDNTNDYKDYYINPDETGDPSDIETIFIDFKYFKDMSNDNEYSKTNADSFRIGSNNETFTDLLYSIAANFNMLVLYDINIIDEVINVTFVDNNVTENQSLIYFKDADAYKNDIQLDADANKTPAYSESFYESGKTFGLTGYSNSGTLYGLEKNGVVMPYKEPIVGGDRVNKPENDSKSGFRILFSISPTLAVLRPSDNDLDDYIKIQRHSQLLKLAGIPYRDLSIPHNIVTKRQIDSDAEVDLVGWEFKTRSLHTAMYVKVNALEEYEPDSYFTPIRAISVGIDGIDYNYDKLEAFINATRTRLFNFINEDLELNIPYWNAFSNSSDGSNPSLNNLKLGKHIQINDNVYVIISYEVDFNKPNINLKLRKKSYFTDVKDPVTIKTGDELLNSNLTSLDDSSKKYIEGPAIKFSALYYNEDGDLESITNKEQIDKYYGLSLEIVADGNASIVSSPGLHYIPELPYSVGTKLYLRITGDHINFSTVPVLSKFHSTDCIYMKLAEVVATNILKLQDKDYFEYV